MSHVNTDFDALASMFAAKKLYPNAQVVISSKQNIPVRQFLTIYRDTLDLVPDNTIDFANVTELILVDEASLSRTGDYAKQLIENDNLKITLYDHHPPKENDVTAHNSTIEQVGATITLLIEKIQQQEVEITPFEANLFALGIYTDTGAFTYSNTTARDFRAASYLMEQGMDLNFVQRFSDVALLPEQQTMLQTLLQQSTTHHIEGLNIVISTHQQDEFLKGLAVVAEKVLEINDADAVFTIVEMKNRVIVVGRANSERINLLPLLTRWHGGGHTQAGSTTLKDLAFETVVDDINDNLDLIIQPANTARDMMTGPVKSISPKTTIEEAGQLMYRYGHSGFPVAEDDTLLGIITRRDLEKANHHGLGHAPVKAYMSTNIVSIAPDTTEEEIQEIIIKRNIGRLPVIENDKIIGIVTRTNIIESLHKQNIAEQDGDNSEKTMLENVHKQVKKQLPPTIYKLLEDISKTADTSQVSVYLIGGIVRDILLEKENDDIDIVVEGDGITFTKQLQEDFGGEIIIHDNFGTATWTHPAGLEIDITSSRLEYYDKPAALPDVETSTLKEDLQRRDFTINAMAINLNEPSFGQLVDPYQGQLDLYDKHVKVLHNLSFVEDPTRILRGVRFESRFGFVMDDQTEQLALQSIDKVNNLSAHRIIEEMTKIFTEVNPINAIERLFELQFWQQFGINSDIKKRSIQQAIRLQMLCEEHHLNQAQASSKNWFDYFLIPFYQAENKPMATKFALTKEQTKTIQEVASLRNMDNLDTLTTTGECHRLLKDYADATICFILAAHNFDNETLIIDYLKTRHDLAKFLTGKDLIEQGLQPGSYFSKILLVLDVAILNKEVTTKDEAIIWLRNQIKDLNI